MCFWALYAPKARSIGGCNRKAVVAGKVQIAWIKHRCGTSQALQNRRFVAQEVVRRYLEPRLEPVFHADSYGYRPGKLGIDAVRQARQRCWRYDWVLDIEAPPRFVSLQ